MAWVAVSLTPLVIWLLAIVGSVHEGVRSYESCVERSRTFLPRAIVGTCCVIHDGFESKFIQHQDRLLIPYADIIRVAWSRVHSVSAVMLLLLLTPNLLYLFSLWLRSARVVLIWLAVLALMSAYVLTALSLVYSIAAFKDS